jgi:hypothetical protein
MLTIERLKEIAKYDPATGEFTRKEATKGAAVGEIMGHTTKPGYVQISIDFKSYMAHRLAWFYMTGGWPTKPYIDHINADPSDNRWCNLREATQTEQNANQKLRKDNKSGYRGVSWCNKPKGWRAQILVNGNHTELGVFESKEDAKFVYDQAAKKYFGEFVRLT